METTLSLHQIIKNKIDAQKELKNLREDFERSEKALNNKINNLIRLEKLSLEDNYIDKIQVAESILYTSGNITVSVDGNSLANRAITDIANGLTHLRKAYFGNKRYEGYYQNSNHTYHCGPSHGSIFDEIGLKKEVRERELSDHEKDCCIYYLKNYDKIKGVTQSL